MDSILFALFVVKGYPEIWRMYLRAMAFDVLKNFHSYIVYTVVYVKPCNRTQGRLHTLFAALLEPRILE